MNPPDEIITNLLAGLAPDQLLEQLAEGFGGEESDDEAEPTLVVSVDEAIASL